jgi:hypothetical protein
MKRKHARIVLHRETLQQLDREQLRQPAGGSGLTACIICPYTWRHRSYCIPC